MKKIAIFASGNGSNAENVVNYFNERNSVETVLILTNNKNAFVNERAKKLGIECVVFSRDEFYKSEKILNILNDKRIDFIVLAGFMWLFPEFYIEKFSQKIVNIHPALLPKYGGKGMYGDNVHKAVEPGDVGAGPDAQVDVGQAANLHLARVHDDDPGPPLLRLHHVAGDEGVGLGGVGAGDEEALGSGTELGDGIGHRSTTERGGQTGHRGGVSEPGAVIYVVRFDHRAGKLLQQIVLLVGTLGRGQEADGIGPGLAVDGGEFLRHQRERFVPGRLLEDRELRQLLDFQHFAQDELELPFRHAIFHFSSSAVSPS